MRAWTPSDTTSAALVAKSVGGGSSALCPVVGNELGGCICPLGVDTSVARHCYDLSYQSTQEAHKFDALFVQILPGYSPAAMKKALSRRGFN